MVVLLTSALDSLMSQAPLLQTGQTYLPECLPWASLQGSSRRGSSPEDTVAGWGLLDGSGTRSSLAANLRR